MKSKKSSPSTSPTMTALPVPSHPNLANHFSAKNKTNPKKNTPSGSPKSTKKAFIVQNISTAIAESAFSSSAFLNSPDPSRLPIPVFDDDDDENIEADYSSELKAENSELAENNGIVFSDKTTKDSPQASISPKTNNGVYFVNKTDTLRQFLNIRPQLTV